LTLLEFEARFVPTRKHQGVFPTYVKIMVHWPFSNLKQDLCPRENTKAFSQHMWKLWCIDPSRVRNEDGNVLRFAPTQKRLRVFPKWDKFLRSFAPVRMTLKSTLSVHSSNSGKRAVRENE